MSTTEIRLLKEMLENGMKNSSKVFIIGHNSPDFDSIGSCLGLYILARHYNKNVFIIVDDDELKIEPGVKRIIEEVRDNIPIIKKSDYLELADKDSLLIVTDVNKKHMISVGDSLDKVGNIIVIDHHTEDQDSINTYKKCISLNVSSASEIVARVLGISRIRYPKNIANYLLAGISLDTNRFTQNTTSITHDVAEKLLYRGASIDDVNSLFLDELDSYCRIRGLIINGTIIKKYSDSLLSPIQVSFTLNRNQPDLIYLKEDYAKAADRMMKFKGIDAAFTLGFVDDGIIHISARSGKKVNVGKIMESMHGGGTRQSAGGRIQSNDLAQVESELMEKVPLGISVDDEIIIEPETVKVKQIKKS